MLGAIGQWWARIRPAPDNFSRPTGVICVLLAACVVTSLGLLVHQRLTTEPLTPGQEYRTRGRPPVEIQNPRHEPLALRCVVTGDGVESTVLVPPSRSMGFSKRGTVLRTGPGPATVVCEDQVSILESWLLPLHRLAGLTLPFTVALFLTLLTHRLGWSRRQRRRSVSL
jgi:hypothetical protein